MKYGQGYRSLEEAVKELCGQETLDSLPQIFYSAYGEVNPVVWREYEDRRDLYHLYHLLNHLNLFGSMYLGSVEQIIRRYTG